MEGQIKSPRRKKIYIMYVRVYAPTGYCYCFERTSVVVYCVFRNICGVCISGWSAVFTIGNGTGPNGKRNGVARGIIIGEADKKSNESGLLLIRGAIKKLWPGNARNGGEEC
jgi:hypothetical protein